MSIPPRFFDELRARLTLSDIVGKRVKITRAGREFKACCPFHQEKTPSFYVNDAKQFYHCFGCGAHGDVIKFVMDHDNLDFMPAIEILASEAGMEVPKPDPQMAKKQQEQKSLYDLMALATRYYQEQLYDQKHREVLDYVCARGVTKDTLQSYHLGYAPSDFEEFRQRAMNAGFTQEQMIEAGLCKKSKYGDGVYGFFRERVMVPVTDIRGRVVAFGGRILPDHLQSKSSDDYTPPKYMNSPDSPVFNKSSLVFGGASARVASGKGQDVIVTEGYFDVIACHQAGFGGAVAPMGTSITEEQLMLLWKLIPEDNESVKAPILCFDGDEAGRRAAVRACRMILPLLQPGRSARFVFLPEGEDPDTLIKNKGAAAFESILKGALDCFDFLWATHTAHRDFKSPDTRAALTKAMDSDINSIQHREVQKHYDRQFRDKMYQTFFAYKGRGGRAGGQKVALGRGAHAARGIPLVKPGSDRRESIIRILMAGILNYPELYSALEEEFGSLDVPRGALSSLHQAIIRTLNDNPALDRSELQRQINSYGLQADMDDVLSQKTYLHGRFVEPDRDNHDVKGRWSELLQELQSITIKQEIEEGWRKAIDDSDTQAEQRIISLTSRANS